MSWSTFLPILNSIVGGVVMGVAIWALVTGKVVRRGEAEIWKGLFEKSEVKVERLEKMVDGLTADLSKQNAGHLETLNLVKSFMQPAVAYTAENHPRRRREDHAP